MNKCQVAKDLSQIAIPKAYDLLRQHYASYVSVSGPVRNQLDNNYAEFYFISLRAYFHTVLRVFFSCKRGFTYFVRLSLLRPPPKHTWSPYAHVHWENCTYF